jgi:hypothetical protein
MGVKGIFMPIWNYKNNEKTFCSTVAMLLPPLKNEKNFFTAVGTIQNLCNFFRYLFMNTPYINIKLYLSFFQSFAIIRKLLFKKIGELSYD